MKDSRRIAVNIVNRVQDLVSGLRREEGITRLVSRNERLSGQARARQSVQSGIRATLRVASGWTSVAFLAAALSVSSSSLHAATFQVNPTRLTLDQGSSGLLTITNQSDEELRFQITGFTWDQNDLGEVQLGPTEDVVVFPSLLIVGPREQRRVRVGIATGQASLEKSYRVFFEELPPPLSSQPEGVGSKITIVTKIGVPVFVAPAISRVEGSVVDLEVPEGNIRFAIRNEGTRHFATRTIRVEGLDEAGTSVFLEEVPGWYVLADRSTQYDYAIPRDICSDLVSIRVEVETDIDAAPEVSVFRAATDRIGCSAE